MATSYPCSQANQDAYRGDGREHAAVLRECGATRIVEAWGDDVPDGKVTDYKGAVQAARDEKVVYAWVEWPSKEVRDSGWKKAMEDPRMQDDTVRRQTYDLRRLRAYPRCVTVG